MANGEGERPVLRVPPLSEFQQLGIELAEELHGGHQSRVFRAVGPAGSDIVVKLIDINTVDQGLASERLRVRNEAAQHDDRVSPLLSFGGSVVNQLGHCLVVGSPFVAGRQPRLGDRHDVERMGSGLALLHRSLRLFSSDLPMVGALRIANRPEPATGHQLLHGDFAPSNLILDDQHRQWVIDFDEAGYGPVEFELGNSLFMAIFDTCQRLDHLSDDYLKFRQWFLEAYQATASDSVSESLVDESLHLRADALRYWLDHLDEAPLGIRSATAEWHRHLRAFVGMA